MKILVTGANGFIGRRLSGRLIFQGHQVYGLSKTEPASMAGFTEYYLQDISKPFTLPISFDLVIHLAAYNITNIGAKDSDLYSAINVQGTQYLLNATKPKRLIYLSTCKVYDREGKPLTETSPLGPVGDYEQSKLKAEQICQTQLPPEVLVILRSVNVIGLGQAPKAVLPIFFQKAKANETLEIMNAAMMMQFVYLEDLIDAIEAVIVHPQACGIFNIAYEQAVNILELAQTIIDLTHSSSPINVHKNVADNLFSPVSCAKAKQQLDWKARTPLTKILEEYAHA